MSPFQIIRSLYVPSTLSFPYSDWLVSSPESLYLSKPVCCYAKQVARNRINDLCKAWPIVVHLNVLAVFKIKFNNRVHLRDTVQFTAVDAIHLFPPYAKPEARLTFAPDSFSVC
jgi:hypothetical protein